MKSAQHKSLVREVAPGIIQIGKNPFDPILTLDEVTKQASLSGGEVLTREDLEDITGNSLIYNSGQFQNRPTVGDKKVLIEGDIEAVNLGPALSGISVEAETRADADILINNSMNDISGLLEQSISSESLERENNDTLLSNSIAIVSGLFYDQIQNLAVDLIETNNNINTISGDINAINNNILNTNTDIAELQSDIISISGDVSNISATTSGISYLDAENLAKKWAIIFG